MKMSQYFQRHKKDIKINISIMSREIKYLLKDLDRKITSIKFFIDFGVFSYSNFQPRMEDIDKAHKRLLQTKSANQILNDYNLQKSLYKEKIAINKIVIKILDLGYDNILEKALLYRDLFIDDLIPADQRVVFYLEDFYSFLYKLVFLSKDERDDPSNNIEYSDTKLKFEFFNHLLRDIKNDVKIENINYVITNNTPLKLNNRFAMLAEDIHGRISNPIYAHHDPENSWDIVLISEDNKYLFYLQKDKELHSHTLFIADLTRPLKINPERYFFKLLHEIPTDEHTGNCKYSKLQYIPESKTIKIYSDTKPIKGTKALKEISYTIND